MSTAAKKERKPRAAKTAAGTPKTTTRKRKSPKSKAPKRPKSAYIIFLSEQRANIIKANPGIAFTDVPKVASEQWKSLKPAQKTKYEKAAEQDRERYKQDMLSYVPSPDDKKKRKKKDPTAPKKANTAFNFYVQERSVKVRASRPGVPMPEIMTFIADEWKGLSDKQKEPFVRMAEKDKQRYLAETQN